MSQAVYDEPFIVAVPHSHAFAGRSTIAADELKRETMLLLGSGHCFRDHVLAVCPELSRFSQESAGIQKTFEGSSLETIRHMVASGVGITVLPWLATPGPGRDGLLSYIPLESPPPSRRVSIVWRKSYTRTAAIAALRSAILTLALPGVSLLPDASPVSH